MRSRCQKCEQYPDWYCNRQTSRGPQPGTSKAQHNRLTQLTSIQKAAPVRRPDSAGSMGDLQDDLALHAQSCHSLQDVGHWSPHRRSLADCIADPGIVAALSEHHLPYTRGRWANPTVRKQ